MRTILLPVTRRTWATPCESRSITPICEGRKPYKIKDITQLHYSHIEKHEITSMVI